MMPTRMRGEAPAHSAATQRGVVLLVMLLILLLGSSYVLVQRLNHVSEVMIQDQATAHALAEARAALLGWSVGHPDRPGMLPYPDRNGDGNYDGNSDCPAGAINANMLLGRLPASGQTAPCIQPLSGLGVNVTDGSGQGLWYAVSRNLLYQPSGGGYPAIDPALPEVSTNWLTVRDEFGNVLSDRVAAVILAPGAALRGQNRAGAAPAAANYLDTATIGATSYSNADFDGVFIAAARGDTFNDQIVYITADELITLAERRVARGAQQCLRSYAAASGGRLSWAAGLDPTAAPDYTGDFGERFGRIPGAPAVDAAPGSPDASMQTVWPAGCFVAGTYWDRWREFVFYAIAPGYIPGGAAGCPVCLEINGGGDHHTVVLAAGRALAGQARSSPAQKGTVTNYLEGENATPADNAFERRAGDAAFNDQILCIGADAECQ